MKRFEMIKDKEYFNSIIKTGKYSKNNLFVIYKVQNIEKREPHFGIAIKKNIGHAVIRNKIKRQVRSIIDNNKKLFKNDTDYIIMIRNECSKVSFNTMNDKLCELMVERKKYEKK